jgi:Tar ligand binding domain homologue
MVRSSIRTKILGIAVGLIALMIGTAGLSLVAAMRVGDRLQQLSESYFPAYSDLSDASIDSLGRALEIRRMIIAKTATPPDPIRYAESIALAEAKLTDIDREERAARALIQNMIENTEFSDTIALTRVEVLLDTILTEIAVILPTKPSACCLCSTAATHRRSPTGSNALKDCATSLAGRCAPLAPTCSLLFKPAPRQRCINNASS